MNGIRILSKMTESKSRLIDYDFDEITNQISEEILGLYWVLSGITFKYKDRNGVVFSEYNDNYEKCIIEEYKNLQLVRRDFIYDNARFIKGDWDIIIGIQNTEFFQEVKWLNYNNLTRYAKVLFSCIDAAFWEIYSPDQTILDKIAKHFPNSERCILDKNKWP